MLNLFALVIFLVASFALTALALPLLLQMALGRFWRCANNPNEFIVQGTHREVRSRPRALVV